MNTKTSLRGKNSLLRMSEDALDVAGVIFVINDQTPVPRIKPVGIIVELNTVLNLYLIMIFYDNKYE